MSYEIAFGIVGRKNRLVAHAHVLGVGVAVHNMVVSFG